MLYLEDYLESMISVSSDGKVLTKILKLPSSHCSDRAFAPRTEGSIYRNARNGFTSSK